MVTLIHLFFLKTWSLIFLTWSHLSFLQYANACHLFFLQLMKTWSNLFFLQHLKTWSLILLTTSEDRVTYFSYNIWRHGHLFFLQQIQRFSHLWCYSVSYLHQHKSLDSRQKYWLFKIFWWWCFPRYFSADCFFIYNHFSSKMTFFNFTSRKKLP